MSIFSERLKELRGNESQASFASCIGLNRVQYAKYENGKNAPSIEILATICRVHSCSADWLLGLNDKPPEVKSVNVVNSSANIAIGNGASVSRDCMACPLLKDHLKRFSKPKKNP